MRAMWAFVLAGCTSTVGAPSGGINDHVFACGAPSPYDDSVFTALTKTTWNVPCSGPFSTCTNVALAADGSYSWTRTTDVVERDDHGTWNFYARTESDGIVCFDNGAVLPYVLGTGTLRLGAIGLSPDQPATQIGSRVALERAEATPIFAQMSARDWHKTNSFDLAMEAQELVLARDGTYNASYRDSTCTHGGAWGVDIENWSTGPTPIVIDIPDANDCDLRGPTSGQLPSSTTPRIDALGRLIFYRSQYQTEGDPRPWFLFDGYSDGVATAGTLDRELTASAPTTFDLDFENRDTISKSLTSLTVRVTPEMLVTDGYQSTGPTVVLASQTLAVTLAPGEHSTLSVSISPAFTGDANLELEFDYSDSRQPYQSRGDFIATIAP